MNKCLEKLTQREMDTTVKKKKNLNCSKLFFHNQNLTRKTISPDDFTGESYQIFKELKKDDLHKFFHKRGNFFILIK